MSAPNPAAAASAPAPARPQSAPAQPHNAESRPHGADSAAAHPHSAEALGRTLTFVAFGTYQADSHPRVRVLIEGLRELGHRVVELNEPLGLSTADRVSMLKQPWRVPALGARLVNRWWTLARRGRQLRKRFAAEGQQLDAVLVGYLGHFDVHLARRVFKGTPIVLDHLIFAAGTAKDRGQKSQLIGRALGAVDQRALAAADVIVVDTAEHQQRVPDELRDRSVVCPVGADESWFRAGTESAADGTSGDGPLSVVFYGLYTPLQGATVIGAAAAQLAGAPVRITMIGKGQERAAAEQAAGAAAQVDWVDWVPAAELPAIVAAHDVALGIFGDTVKAREVVPNKVYQAAAAGCAIVTADTPPQRRVLGEAAELVAPQADRLAADLRRLAGDRELLAERRRQAGALAAAEFTPWAVAAPLVAKVCPVTNTSGSAPSPSTKAPAAPLSPRAALRWPLIKRGTRRVAPRRLLEIGAGQGAMGARLVGLTDYYLAVEPDETSYQAAKSRIEPRGGTVVNGTSDDLTDPEPFDLVCAFEVLEHLEDDAGALRSWAPLVAPGGYVLVSVPAWQHMFGPWDKAVGHYRRYSPDELSQLFSDNGFEPVDVSLYGWPLAFALEAIRNRVATGEPKSEESASQQTAESGRWLQPSRKISELAVDIGILPFQGLQRLVPSKGNGIVALARKRS